MQRIAGNDTAFERQHAKYFQPLPWPRCDPAPLREASAIRASRRKDVDHMQRRAAFAPLVSAPQRLSIDWQPFR